MVSGTKIRQEVAGAVFAGLLLGLAAVLPIGAYADPDQAQVRISLFIPERAAIVEPAIELPLEGSPRLCNRHRGEALYEVHLQDSDEPLGDCARDTALAKASGRHRVLITPI